MKNNVYTSIALAGVIALQGFGSLVHADVVIDGQTYSNAWIAANPAEVAKYINANPASAATILQNVDSSTRASVLEAYNRQSGTTYTVDTGMAALNQTVATTTAPSNLVTIGNQAYTNDWIIAHPKEVATYIDQHPNEALSIIEKLSTASQTAIVKAYNQANKTNYTVSAGLAVLKQVNTNTASAVGRIISAKDKNGYLSNVDVDFLAQSMKNGTFDLDNFFTNNHAKYALGFTDVEIAEFKAFVKSSTAKQVADKLATFSPENIVKIDSMRPAASVGIAWRTDAQYLANQIKQQPESWQNVLEYAGIPATKEYMDKLYKMSFAEFKNLLSGLPNHQFEKIQAYYYNSTDITGKPVFDKGWDDKSAYSPEIGRVVSAAEKNAIERIKYYISMTLFSSDPGRGVLSALGKSKLESGENEGYLRFKPDAFKPYLTEAAIADYVKNPNKGVFAGGTNGQITWKNDVVTTTTPSTPVKTTPTTPVVTTPVKTTPVVTPPVATTPTTVISQTLKAKIDAWIASKIVSQQYIMSNEEYTNFIAKRIKAATNLKVGKKQNVVNQLNYIISELTKIQDQLDEELSLDDLLK